MPKYFNVYFLASKDILLHDHSQNQEINTDLSTLHTIFKFGQVTLMFFVAKEKKKGFFLV